MYSFNNYTNYNNGGKVSSYKIDTNAVRQRLHQTNKKTSANQQQDAAILISEEGRRALKEKMSAIKTQKLADIKNLPSLSSGYSSIMNDFEKIMSELGGGSVSDDFVTRDYSQRSVDALKARFEKEEGTKSDTFDSYVNKMASTYQLMKDRIEEKYAASDRQKEYYVAEDGSTQELTKEKELEMLDKAYKTHSQFMATSTQIWSELKDFKVQITYHSSGKEMKAPTTQNQNTGIKKQAYRAFISAINEENSELLKNKTGSLNHFRLNLELSSFERNTLNGIWDYYANKK